MDGFFQEDESSYTESAVSILRDDRNKDEVESLVQQIESTHGFPKTRRPSLRDNPLISDLKRAIQNGPGLTEIVVDNDMCPLGQLRINFSLTS